MDRVIIACVQQRMKLHGTIDEYRADLRRFLQVAHNKQANLVLFPELAGVLVAPPLLRDLRSNLLKRADLGRRKESGLWLRISGVLANRTAVWLGADLRTSLRALLAAAAPQVWASYANLFGELAREFQTVLVAPSAYLPDPADGEIRNLAAVFGSDGVLLGHQAKVILHPEDEGLAQAGETWLPIATPMGALGLMLGGDVLFPEVGRLLAYQGAEALLLLGACSTPVLYHKLRAGILARMQDNQLFAAASFAVGAYSWGRPHDQLQGKSAIFAPQELTPRLNGVLVEMGSQRSEGVLTAEWDFVALRNLWDHSETPLRRQLPVTQAAQVLARLYERLRGLPRMHDAALLVEPNGQGDASTEQADAHGQPLSLDELPVIGVVTRRWLGVRPAPTLQEAPLDLSQLPEQLVALGINALPPGAEHSEEYELPDANAEDETDEMDALPHGAPEKPG